MRRLNQALEKQNQKTFSPVFQKKIAICTETRILSFSTATQILMPCKSVYFNFFKYFDLV